MATLEMHTGSTKNGTYRKVVGEVVEYGARPLTWSHSVRTVTIRTAEGELVTEPMGRTREVEPVAETTRPVGVHAEKVGRITVEFVTFKIGRKTYTEPLVFVRSCLAGFDPRTVMPGRMGAAMRRKREDLRILAGEIGLPMSEAHKIAPAVRKALYGR